MRNIGNRFRAWVERERARGDSAAGLMLRALPRKIARKGALALPQAANRLLLPLHDSTYRARAAAAFGRTGADPLVLVAVPHILHYVIPCLTLATPHVGVVLVLNGLARWEEEILDRRFPELPRIRLEPLPRSMLAHGSVLDLLLRHAERRFTLLDPDLFVFDPAVFAELELRPGEIAVGAYGFTNRKTGLRFPTTHLLALDVPSLQSLMARHRVGPAIYRRTPPHLVARLGTLGLGDHNFVRDHLPHYDPLNLLLALAVYEGFRFRILDRAERDVFHVGGVSYLERNAVLDRIDARLLAAPYARDFADRYRRRRPTRDETHASRPAALDGSLCERIDRAVDRLLACVSAG